MTRTATYLGATDFEPVVPDFDIELGYLYGRARVHADPHETHAELGSRAPHVWLTRDGRRISSLDLFGTSFVLLAGPDGAAWFSNASPREWLE
ncbi:MAG TPA: monooxygenase, partial [Chloroflexota bacterium]|nr:monooxygenase [Chloroflexota bacterium]